MKWPNFISIFGYDDAMTLLWKKLHLLIRSCSFEWIHFHNKVIVSSASKSTLKKGIFTLFSAGNHTFNMYPTCFYSESVTMLGVTLSKLARLIQMAWLLTSPGIFIPHLSLLCILRLSCVAFSWQVFTSLITTGYHNLTEELTKVSFDPN